MGTGAGWLSTRRLGRLLTHLQPGLSEGGIGPPHVYVRPLLSPPSDVKWCNVVVAGTEIDDLEAQSQRHGPRFSLGARAGHAVSDRPTWATTL